jgi:hypothetical protein
MKSRLARNWSWIGGTFYFELDLKTTNETDFINLFQQTNFPTI